MKQTIILPGFSCLLFLLIQGLLLTVPEPAISQTIEPAEPSEQQVKAAYLYNFAKFVEWPNNAFKNPKDPIHVGIIGEDPFGPILDQMVKGKQLKGRSFKIDRIQPSAINKNYQIVYISSQNLGKAKNILQHFSNHPVLTVGDVNGFASAGGCINFTLRQNRILFEINIDATHRAGLTISSRLLRLAELVEEKR